MFKQIKKHCRGFTLIELVIVIALVGIIGSGLAININQIYSGGAASNNRMTAINNARYAGNYIIADIMSAQDLSFASTPALPTVLDIKWYDYTNSILSEIKYSIPTGSENLVRQYYVGGVKQSETVVAHYITSLNYTVDPNTYVVSLTITATAGNLNNQKTETVNYKVCPRA